MARQGARPAGRRAQRAVVHAPPDQARQGPLRGLDARARLADRQPDLGLRRARARMREPDAEEVLQEINGYDVADGRRRSPSFAAAQGRRLDRVRLLDLRGHATPTASTRRAAATPATSTTQGGWVSPEWGWAWPANRRILYNRASADPRGPPVERAQEVRLVGRGAGQVDGLRRPRLPGRQAARTTAPPEDAAGMDAIARRRPVHHDGRRPGWLYSPSGLLDGPLPTHYEPLESPVAQPAVPRQSAPTRPPSAGTGPTTRSTPSGDPRYPVVADDVPADRAPHRRAG